MRLRGGLSRSTLQMLLCTDSMYSLCAFPLLSLGQQWVGYLEPAFLEKKGKDCVTINDLLLCLGATVLQDFVLMELAAERTNLTNFINSSLV